MMIRNKILFSVLGGLISPILMAQNPIVQTCYTTDPAPMVHDGRLYVYTGHDEDKADFFWMQEWRVYSTDDMVNWTDHGSPLAIESFEWADDRAWAAQCVERQGKFYWYVCLHSKLTGAMAIGVAVGDSPVGPFRDAIGKPLCDGSWDYIDPTVYIDDDGRAFLYWGNPNCYYVKLNEDMISYSGDIVKLKETPEHYQEGPWFYKRNGHYYLAFASTCCPEGIGYAMSDSPTGPWKTKGYIMRPTERTRGNHPGIMDYKGKSYVFGLNYDLLKLETNTHYERRSVSVAEMHYNEDGTIQEVPYWADTKLEQIGTFNPFRKVEAETMAWGYGLKTAPNADKSLSVVDVNNGEYICVRGVNFGKNKARRFEVSALPLEGGNLKIRLDAPDGKIVGNVNIPQGNETSKYELYSCEVNAVSGIHDLYLSFEGENNKDLFELDYWKF